MKFSLWSRPRAIVPRGAALLGVGLAAFTAGAAGAQPAHVARDLDAAVRKAPQAGQSPSNHERSLVRQSGSEHQRVVL